MSRIDWPLDVNRIRRGSDRNTFGPVRTDARGNPRNHQGWDFYAAKGTPCYAVADGVVAGVKSGGDYGLVIVVQFQHATQGTVFAAYAHLKSAHVEAGDRVTCGQQIGLTGDSGNAAGMTGPDSHLHFEIRTTPWPGRGLDGRMSPLKVFGVCPKVQPIRRAGA